VQLSSSSSPTTTPQAASAAVIMDDLKVEVLFDNGAYYEVSRVETVHLVAMAMAM
jgi:hypothetical protein